MTRIMVLCVAMIALGCPMQGPLGAAAPSFVEPVSTTSLKGPAPEEDNPSIFGWKKKQKVPAVKACGQGLPACGSGKFCELNTSGISCSAATRGSCADIPTACTREYRPVCGCDGKTYANDCGRRAAAVPLAHTGACEKTPLPGKTPPAGTAPEGAMCAGIAGIRCAEGLFCEMTEKDGLTCNTPDRAGTCATKPEVCTFDYRPVCGCDGKTYGNDCARRSAGVGRASEGACPEKAPISEPPVIQPAGQRIPIEGVLLTLEPTACKSNPWEKATGLTKSLLSAKDSELGVIDSFFQSKKINLVEVGLLKGVVTIATCRACTCPRGDVLVVVAKKEDVEVLKKDFKFSEMAAGSFMAATPLACNMNPWNKLAGADEFAQLAEYLKGQPGEAQYAGFLYPTTPRAVCAACTCPRGDRLVVKAKSTSTPPAGFSVIP